MGSYTRVDAYFRRCLQFSRVLYLALALSPGPWRGGERAWYKLFAHALLPKNTSTSDAIVYLSAHKSVYMSVLYGLLLDTCPLNHIVIVLFHYKQITLVKYCCLCALQAIVKNNDVKKDCELASMLPRLLLGVFKDKLDSCTGE